MLLLISQFEKQEMIDKLIALSFSPFQWNELARKYDINPNDIYAEKATNPEKSEAIVNKICQIQEHQNFIACAKELCQSTVQKIPVEIAIRNNLSKLDTAVSIKFGNLYKELLEKIELAESINGDEDVVEDNNVLEAEERQFVDFKDKLENKAKFSKSNRELAIERKNDNTVLKRKAQKLGFGQYEEINNRIRHIYNNRILTNYPSHIFNADNRLSIILNELFDYLPPEFQEDDEAIDYLYGMIFDTTFKCFIFNE
jgi:hypothetical protein